ncbi:MAG: EAL domain-containing protein, partial [Pseudomonadales bacterium]|nr:EAL domain-containing protein [Pseudomonadales bacterium]
EDLPVIIVSGEIGEDVAVNAMYQGAQDYIMKDNLARLIPVIHREVKLNADRKAKRDAEESLQYLAYHDSLTDLVNRAEFERCLDHAVQMAKLEKQSSILMFLDLDQFKLVNDTCGHVAGDELLVKITRLLKLHTRETDTLARLGGDEFGILLNHCRKQEAVTTAERIRSEVQDCRFVWQDKPFSITISIGMAEITDQLQNHHELLSCADIACYVSKDKGRNNITWYNPNDNEFHQRRAEMQWAPKIKRAAEDDKFVLFHQPMANLQQDLGPHWEFLVRLKDDQELVPPGAFIPAAERYNLMPIIDRWVVKHVFHFLQHSGLGYKNQGTYFINLSGSTLSDGSFFEDVKRLQEASGLLPERICFEITETAAIANLVDAVQFIEEIREKGFKFALDDFGVGLSSFSYLKTIPVDYLKIDGSFVKRMLSDPIDRGIAEACNQIGHAAGLQTIAEFVEDEATMDALRNVGVNFAQGFGIAKPGPLPTLWLDSPSDSPSPQHNAST